MPRPALGASFLHARPGFLRSLWSTETRYFARFLLGHLSVTGFLGCLKAGASSLEPLFAAGSERFAPLPQRDGFLQRDSPLFELADHSNEFVSCLFVAHLGYVGVGDFLVAHEFSLVIEPQLLDPCVNDAVANDDVEGILRAHLGLLGDHRAVCFSRNRVSAIKRALRGKPSEMRGKLYHL